MGVEDYVAMVKVDRVCVCACLGMKEKRVMSVLQFHITR